MAAPTMEFAFSRRTLALSLATVCTFSSLAAAQMPGAEWRYYGGDERGTRYSPLAEIDRANVKRLERAWVYHTGELGYGPTAVTLNGKALRFDREANPYRAGGVEVSMAAVREILADSANVLEIRLR